LSTFFFFPFCLKGPGELQKHTVRGSQNSASTIVSCVNRVLCRQSCKTQKQGLENVLMKLPKLMDREDFDSQFFETLLVIKLI
jgi:hypothetical protein